MTGQRLLWLGRGIVALVVLECLVWLVAGSIAWSFRDLIVGPTSPEAASRARFAIAIFGGAAINGLALLPFLLRPRGWGWFLLVAVQIGDVLGSLAWVRFISHDWWLTTGVGGLTVALLCLFRYLSQRPVPANRETGRKLMRRET